IQHVDAYGDEELLPVVAAALDRNRTALLGGKQSIDEEEQWKGPAGGGDAG
ncbi:MAG: formate dehydrogenase, partial [Azoarcus sp.]|nr:formate dehydrogenase [Azoarcus sp.]